MKRLKDKYEKLSEILKQIGYPRLSIYVLQDRTEKMLNTYINLILILDKTGKAVKLLFENNLVRI